MLGTTLSLVRVVALVRSNIGLFLRVLKFDGVKFMVHALVAVFRGKRLLHVNFSIIIYQFS